MKSYAALSFPQTVTFPSEEQYGATEREDIRSHINALRLALDALEEQYGKTIECWGAHLAESLMDGARCLIGGNGGSAAHAQHLSAELVGRYLSDRKPLSALCLHADTSSLTAICNDYGHEEGFARQVEAHGRPGDILLLLSTSGASRNVIRAAEVAKDIGMTAWGLTGAGPNPLSVVTDDVITIAGATATVQEMHQVVIHLLCAAIDKRVCP